MRIWSSHQSPCRRVILHHRRAARKAVVAAKRVHSPALTSFVGSTKTTSFLKLLRVESIVTGRRVQYVAAG